MASTAAGKLIRMRALVLVVLVVYTAAVPMKVYEKTNGEKYKQVLVPVGSTVIPLDELPVYQVGTGFGFNVTPDPGIRKPDEPTKLITIKSKKKNKKDSDAALIEEVTKEEYQKIIRGE